MPQKRIMLYFPILTVWYELEQNASRQAQKGYANLVGIFLTDKKQTYVDK